MPALILAEMKDVKFVFASGKSELSPYKEIFHENIYNRDPHFAIKNGDTVIDVGAHIGFYSLHGGLKMKNGQILAFEPNPDTFSRLEKNIELNNLNNIINAWNKAVAACSGTVNLRISKNSSEGNTIMARGTVAEYDEVMPVAAITLDDIVRKSYLSKIDMLKIDAEGAEVEILKGGMEKAMPIVQKIIIETHSPELRKSCEKILSEAGFDKVLAVPSGVNMLGENAAVYFVKK